MKRIGILRSEVDRGEGMDIVSYIKNNLSDKYEPVDVLIYEDGSWNINGLLVLPSELVHKIDVAWNVSRPRLNQVLTNFSIPHVSIPVFSRALKQSKDMLREHMKRSGVNMPMHFVLPAYQADFDGSIESYASKGAKKVFEKFGSPWIVKSLTPDVSMGVHIANTYPELVNAIIDGAEHGGSIIVEELVQGREVSMHSLSNFRGQENYIFPKTLKDTEKEDLYKIIQNLHEDTGANYIKSNFIMNPRRGVYLKNLEFMPDFNEGSDLHRVSQSVGANLNHVLESILENAR